MRFSHTDHNGKLTILRFAIAAALALSLPFLLAGQSENPPVTNTSKGTDVSAPAQPIPFSHKKHLALGVKCELCHTSPDPGINVTLPAATQCMICHVSVAKNKPAIQKLAEYDKEKKPIPWARVYAVPAWVYWNHRTHLQTKVECQSCHGDVAQMDTMKVATNVTSMQGCVDCHQERNAPVGCDTCHDNMTQ